MLKNLKNRLKSSTDDSETIIIIESNENDEDKFDPTSDVYRNIVEEMQGENGIEVKDRKWMLRTYPKCFIGSECIDWFIQRGHVKSREDGVALGQHLLENGIFSHVTKDHQFKDDFLFYRFKDDFEKKSRTNHHMTASWKTMFESLVEPDPSLDHNLQPDIPISPPELIKAFEDLEISPIDEHNAKLLDYVHPHNYSDPLVDGSQIYNLVVIGAGAGGLVSAAGTAGLGAKVAIIEQKLMGGDCLNYGCVPSKALLHCAKSISSLRRANSFIKINGEVEIDFQEIMQRMRKLRSEIAINDSVERFESLDIDIFMGHATFAGRDSIEVNGQILKFRKAIIATGGTPALPPIEGLTTIPYLTNTTIYNLTKLPKSLLIIGSGAIGCEMAQAFANFGSKVYLTNRSSRILVREEEEASKIIHQSLVDDGVNILVSVNFQKFESLEDGSIRATLISNEEQIELVVEYVLVSVGKKPNVENLNLETAGVEYNQQTGIKVNKLLQTTNKHVYAVGDCCSKYKFTHVADFMARMAIRNAFFFGSSKFQALIIPWAVYTYPELAHVGLYLNDLIKKKIAYDVYEKSFDHLDRAKLDGEPGFIRVYTRRGEDKILGCTIVAPNAGDMISEVTLAITNGIGLSSIAITIHPYPSYAESIRQIGDLYNRSRLTPTVKTLFRKLFTTYRKVDI